MSGLSYLQQGGQPEEQQQPPTTDTRYQTKPVAPAGRLRLPTPSDSVPMNQNTLQAMEEMYQEMLARQTGMRGFLESAKDAQAWWTPGGAQRAQALNVRTEAREKQAADLFNMRAQIAQNKAAMESAERMGSSLDSIFSGAQGASKAAVSPQGIPIPPDVVSRVNRIRQTQGPAAAMKAFNDWESTRLTEQSRGRYNPQTFRPEIEVRISGTNETELIDANVAGKLSDYGISEPTWEQLDDIKSGRAPRKAQPAAPVKQQTAGELTAEDRAIETKAPAQAAVTARPEPAQAAVTARPEPAPIQPPAPETKPTNYTFEELTPQQLGVARGIANQGMGLLNDIIDRPDAAEIFNNLPLEDRKKLFNAIGTDESVQPTQLAQAPTQTATDAVPQAPAPARVPAPVERKGLPRIKSEMKVETETETARITELKKKDSERLDLAREAARTAEDRIVKMQRMAELVESAPEFYGLADVPGGGGALIGAAMSGVKIGQNGQIAMPGVEDFVRKVSPSLRRMYPDEKVYKQKLAEVKEVASYLHEVELAASQAYKGQGQVSDYERKILAAIAGSTSDPAQLLALKARWFEMKAQNDKELGALIRAVRKEKGPMVAMYTIEDDPRFEQMRATQQARVRNFFSPELVNKANTIDLNNLPAQGPGTTTPAARRATQPQSAPNTSLRDKYTR